jgi:hypothetical protein
MTTSKAIEESRMEEKASLNTSSHLQRLTATAYAFYVLSPCLSMRYRQGIALPWELLLTMKKGSRFGEICSLDFGQSGILMNKSGFLVAPFIRIEFLEIKSQLPIDLRPFWKTNQDWEKVKVLVNKSISK